jgi:hypothetical protein
VGFQGETQVTNELCAWKKHAAKLREEAFRYLLDGYAVQAIVEGWFERPDYINGYLPDIVACKEGKCIIIEVKIPEEEQRDTPKLLAFEDLVRHSPDWQLRVVSAE